MTEYHLTIPGRPMRKNEMNKLVTRRLRSGRVIPALVPTKRYEAYLKAVCDAATLARIPAFNPGLWELEVAAYWPDDRSNGFATFPNGDADAALVPTRDALEAASVLEDDGQITRCICEARHDPDEPRTEVTLRRIG